MDDLEGFWFYLKKNPYVFEEYKTLKKGYKKRSPQQIERAYYNNIKWTNTLLLELIKKSHIQAVQFKKKIKKVKRKKQKGLDAWM